MNAARLLPNAVCVALLACMLVMTVVSAAPARAAERSANITHLRRVAFSDVGGRNRGSDLEFVTLTLGQRARQRLRAQRGDDPADAQPKRRGLQRRYAMTGTLGNGLQIVDVTEPQAFVAKRYDCRVHQGDVQKFRRGRRSYVTYSWDYGGAGDSACVEEARALGFTPGVGVFIIEITNPYRPRTVSLVRVPKGSHNATVRPGGKVLYNSNSDLHGDEEAGVGIEVFDIRDFAYPRQEAFVPLPVSQGFGSEAHDITFNASGSRAYVAALSQGVILDTERPLRPKVLTVFDDDAIHVWHQAAAVTLTRGGASRTFLLVEDEYAGAAGTGRCPSGGVHVYDITGGRELDPVKLGYWNLHDRRAFDESLSCTAHVFRLHAREALMTIAYYQGGVRVVGLGGLLRVAAGEDVRGMRQLAYWYVADDPAAPGADARASNTWAFKAPIVRRDRPFRAYAGDIARGLDVFRIDLRDRSTWSRQRGVWLTPDEATARFATIAAQAPADQLVCQLQGGAAQR